MFIGHFAIGLGAKTLKPSISLGSYFLAVQFVDLLWPTLLLFGLEQVAIVPGITAVTPLDFISYPYSHSFVMALIWSALGFGITYLIRQDLAVSFLIGACVGSHWLLDFLTHRPDLPLTLSETTKVGLGLWYYKAATVMLESVLFVSGAWLYLRKTEAQDKVGSVGLWSLIIFMTVIHLSNISGPPPPSVSAIAWAGHLQWLFVIWAYWVDKHRRVV